MELSHVYNTAEIDKKISEDLWDNMMGHYEYLKTGNKFIRYPDKEFKIQGIPAPWQIIAWRKLIMMMGEDNFKTLPRVLYYSGNSNVFFETDFNDHFGNSANPEELEVTFACGYFWRFDENKRDKMLNFVVDKLLKKGTPVIIWTQDDTLKEVLGKKCKEKLGDSVGGKLRVNHVSERIDVHHTLVEDKNDTNNSRLYMELPHTEAYDFKLETYLTFEKLKSFDCEPKEIKKVLKSFITCLYRPHLVKRFLSWRNIALNTG